MVQGGARTARGDYTEGGHNPNHYLKGKSVPCNPEFFLGPREEMGAKPHLTYRAQSWNS